MTVNENIFAMLGRTFSSLSGDAVEKGRDTEAYELNKIVKSPQTWTQIADELWIRVPDKPGPRSLCVSSSVIRFKLFCEQIIAQPEVTLTSFDN